MSCLFFNRFRMRDRGTLTLTSAYDGALAAIMLLEQDGFGGDHLVSGPESVTADELASRHSAGLGKPFTFHAKPLDLFERDVARRWGRAWGSVSHPSFATSANIRTMPTGYSPRCGQGYCQAHSNRDRGVKTAEMLAFPIMPGHHQLGTS